MGQFWDIAEGYDRYRPGEPGPFDRKLPQDYFQLVSDLKKKAYGGDPSINDLADAATKLTPDQVRDILETRRQMKEQAIADEIAAREKALADRLEEARIRPPEPGKPIGILKAIRENGGIDIGTNDLRLSITGDATAKGWPSGVFSKSGKKRWNIEQMARLLAEEGKYAINLDDPADPVESTSLLT